jgi:cytochrome c oxidase assembly protein subunit 15
MHRGLKWLAVLSSLGMLFVLIGGALVTKTNSALGCGHSWPLCNGQLIPDHVTIATVIELAHRLVSGGVGFFVIALSIWSWIAIGHKRETKFLAILSVLFLVLQALIGAAAVVWGQSAFVLALHFGISLISFASILLLTLLIFEVDKKFDAATLSISKKMKWNIIGVTIYTYIAVYTGALVRHAHAALICKDWPLCINAQPALPANMYEWIQMGHRLAAAILFVWIAYITYLAVKHYKQQRVIYWGWIIAFGLILFQVITGAFSIYTRLNLYITLLHALLISCLFGLLCYFVMLASRSKVKESAGTSPAAKENISSSHPSTLS